MIIAEFKEGQTRCYTKRAFQFDKGQKLIVTGIELPDTFEVHISNQTDGGIAAAYQGDTDGVYIPDAFFVSGEYVYVWLYSTVSDDEESEKKVGETIYEIVIPVQKRPVHISVSDQGYKSGYIVDDETLIPVSSQNN